MRNSCQGVVVSPVFVALALAIGRVLSAVDPDLIGGLDAVVSEDAVTAL